MEEWAIAGLVGLAAGYGARFWQERVAQVVERPARVAVRTVGSALGTGAAVGGRAAGAGVSLGVGVVRGGVATVAFGAGVASRAAARRAGRGDGGERLTRIQVS